jgi:hypothetical protein
MPTDFDAVYEFLDRHGYLAHHGVLGMHWGVRHDKPSHPRQSHGGSSPSDHEKAVLSAAGANQHSEAYLKDRYGPPEKKKGLSEGQKKALLGAGLGLVAVGYIGVMVAEHRMNAKAALAMGQKLKEGDAGWNFQKFLLASNDKKFGNMMGWDDARVAALKTERISLDPGSILKRVSTEKESMIRSDGFFATFKDEDVNRYKAVLPIYWKQWGKDAESGFVVHLKANAKISAPSEKEAYDLFKGSFDDKIEIPDLFGGPTSRVTFRSWVQSNFASGMDPHASDDDIAKAVYAQWSGNWANEVAKQDPSVQHFFQKVMGGGHNALVDTNDAGSIGDAPLRVLDGSLFDIAGHEELSSAGIKAAQDAILHLAHAVLALGRAFIGKLLIKKGGDK